MVSIAIEVREEEDIIRRESSKVSTGVDQDIYEKAV